MTGVGALIFFYAGFYFEDATDHNRFIAWLLAFAGSMLLVVLSGNLLLTFVAWELTSVTSFMLIGFNGRNNAEAREGAFKALFVTGAGALDHWLSSAWLAVKYFIPMKAFALSRTSTKSCKRMVQARMVPYLYSADFARWLNQERSVSLPFLAAWRHERTHPSERLFAQRDHG